MCGLFGWIINEHDDNAVSASKMHIVGTVLAARNDERGGDSWGYFDGQRVERGLGDILDAHGDNSLAQSAFMLAHTRLATTGAKTVENAHPFEVVGSVRHIIGAHNGMVSNHVMLNTKYHRTCQVDSMHIFEHLANGVKPKDITAYGAITYQSADGVFASRFHGGQLSAVTVAGGLIWSSAADSLMLALRIARIPVVRVFQFGDQTLYRLSHDGIRKVGRLSIAEPMYSGKWSYGDWDDIETVDNYGTAKKPTIADADDIDDLEDYANAIHNLAKEDKYASATAARIAASSAVPNSIYALSERLKREET